MLRILTLGGLGIQLNDEPVGGFVSRKAEALLIYLALHPREHARETLSNLLWDDLSQQQALSYLRTVLSSLQKQLTPYLQITRHTVTLNPEMPLWVDVQELEQSLNVAVEQWEKRGHFTRLTARQLEEALALFKGDFLKGFFVRDCREFEDWMLLRQEQIRGQVLEAFYRLGRHYQHQQAWSAGIQCTARVLELDPLYEAGYRQMMLLLSFSGQRAAALEQYKNCYRILQDELGVDPEDETIALYESIVSGKLPVPAPSTAAVTLPTFGTPFVDRPVEMEAISTYLNDANCRLLTLIGPGGIGKTRLGLEYARQSQEDYSDGIYFASFVGVREPDRIPETIANAIGADLNGDFSSPKNLASYLRDRESLFILDNFEDVLSNAEVLSQLLQDTTSIKFLVTSRERLNLVEEWLYPVKELTVPQDSSLQPQQYAAVQLFIQSARRVQPDFSVDQDLDAVIAICQAVEGVPLAIELAASWVRFMSCQQIIQEIRRGPDFLVTTLRNVPQRHQSMNTVFDSSWQLLTEDERHDLRQLSVFRGGFTGDAASYVVSASLLTLTSFVDKSLLRSLNRRYEMHELLRQFVKERLQEHPEEENQARQRHSSYYAHYASKRESKLADGLSRTQFEELLHEVENIRLGWQYALDNLQTDEISLYLQPLYQLYNKQHNYRDAEALFELAVQKLRAIDSDDVQFLIARAQMFQGVCNFRIDRYAAAESLLLSALPVLERHHAQAELVFCLLILGRSMAASGSYWKARLYYLQVKHLLRTSPHTLEYCEICFRLGSAATMLGKYDEARQHLQDGFAALERLDNTDLHMGYYVHCGDLDVRLGNFAAAQAAFEQALDLSIKLGSQNDEAMILADLAQVLIPLGDYERAKAVCQQSIERNRKFYNRWGNAYGLLHLGKAHLALGENEAAEQCFAEGISICEENRIQNMHVSLLCQQARLLLGRGDTDAAFLRLHDALLRAAKVQIPPLILEVLAGLAAVSAQRGNDEIAVLAADGILHDPAATFEARQEAAAVLQKVGKAQTDDPVSLMGTQTIVNLFLSYPQN